MYCKCSLLKQNPVAPPCDNTRRSAVSSAVSQNHDQAGVVMYSVWHIHDWRSKSAAPLNHPSVYHTSTPEYLLRITGGKPSDH